MNPNAKEIVRMRHVALRAIRNHFDALGFLEVDAPVLISANAVEEEIDPLQVQLTHPINGTSQLLYLMTSPELHMKRLLSRGLEKIYFLGHVFRDKEFSRIHRPEFLMLEWYETGSNIKSLVAQTQRLFYDLSQELSKACPVLRPMQSDFELLSMASAWENFAQIDLLDCLYQISKGQKDALETAVQKTGEDLRPGANFSDAFAHIMLKKIEPNIGQAVPTVLYDWPAQMASLANLNPENPLLAERFEIYWGGLELANGFSELTDPEVQKQRFQDANTKRKADQRLVLPIHREFLGELAEMAPACGIAVGIDRLLALLIGKTELAFVLPADQLAGRQSW